ncbi:MAG: SMC family ATPase, partial [Rubricoccaceae bacterium]|nr:SMC family ATPase [Rubricoccaceae bacterium]
AERLAAFDERAREVERLRGALARLAERQAKRAAEAEALAGRIAEAEALVGRADGITAAYERHEALLTERTALDEQATLFRGLEKQIAEQRLLLQEERLRLEGRLDRVKDAVASDRQRLDEDDRRLQERPRLLDRLKRAEAAADEYERLQAVEAERTAVQQRISHLDTRLSHARGHLKGELNTLRTQLAEARAATATVDALREEERTLDASAAQVQAWQRDQEEVREEGVAVKASLAAAEAERQRLEGALAELDERRSRLRSTDAEACPTCGTSLTAEHRRFVEGTYAKEETALREQAAALDRRIRALEAERDGLRQRFLALRQRIEETNGVAARLVQVRERIGRLADEQAAHERRRAHADEVERLLREETFEPEARAQRTALQEQLDATPFDEERYAAVRAEAAGLSALRERRDELDTIASRRDDLSRRIQRQEAEAARLRADLDAGTTLAPIREQLDALTQRRDGLGYDGGRHEAVTRELTALAEAPKQFTRLMEAQRNLTEWVQRRAGLAEEEAALRDETAKQEAALRDAEAALSDRPETVRRHAEAVAAREQAEQRLSAAQSRLGALRERLARCAQDREQLKAARAAQREAKQEAALYRHLRGAFGKNGIPSLIIEETLPEIEDRANALLERLSNGRTRVALETLADKKAGGTKETLDIRITDDQGVARPYETYSGGEAFRVNFALRIALAQLLAERAGVRIRTLVVDEGFGTQDKQGIQNLVEAIRTIQDDFDKILVITHLDELKDAFPIRIEVTKRPVVGSTFEVLGI